LLLLLLFELLKKRGWC